MLCAPVCFSVPPPRCHTLCVPTAAPHIGDSTPPQASLTPVPPPSLSSPLPQGDPRWVLADPICTFVFAVLVLLTTRNIIRDIINILVGVWREEGHRGGGQRRREGEEGGSGAVGGRGRAGWRAHPGIPAPFWLAVCGGRTLCT